MSHRDGAAGAELTVHAHAKLNLFLRVLARRDDGFHDIESLILPLELHDLVTVGPGSGLSVDLTGPTADAVRSDDDDLVLMAARRLAREGGLRDPGARIIVEKHVPVAAGLGGGSADAAAALRLLNAFWACGLEPAALAALGAGVGSDVPALLADAAVFVTGRGERVEPVHVPTTWWVVRPFPFRVRTPDAYGWWDAKPATGPDPGALVAAAETGNDELLGSALFDDLQPLVADRHPEIAHTIEAFHTAGALGAVMTGSGPTVVALASSLSHADRLGEAVPGSIVTSGPPVPVRAVPPMG